MIERILNGTKIMIDENEANVLYFEREIANKLNSMKIEEIANTIYEINNQYIPIIVFNEITPLCNFKCPFCYINHNVTNFKVPPIDYYFSFYDELIERGMLYCTLTGGEVLTHPYFEEIYRHLKRKGVLVSVFTNGSLLNEKLFSLFKELKPFQIEISIYSTSITDFKKATMCQKDYCQTVLDNILKLKNNGINVKCKTQLNKLTFDGYLEIKKWCSAHGIAYYVSSELQNRYDGSSTNEFNLSEENHMQIYLERLKNADHFEKIKDQKKYFHCGAGKYGLMVSSDFIIRPCSSFYSIKDANFKINYDLNLVLLSLKKYINDKKGKTLNGCQGCTAYSICKECILSDLLKKDKNCEFYNEIIEKV